ncbi:MULTISPECIES: hypothetical protein [Variovorax]|uniref:hypothetical protein n=1 Tax=Variovorax TaxID=34072 RepID=UPI00037D07FA|nr:hypothetical protein [Variovorax paradoxus]
MISTATLRRASALAVLSIVVVLAGCASSANREAMTPTSIASSKKLPYSLSVKTGGGNETNPLWSSDIANEDLAAAIEKAVTQSTLFKEVVKGKSGDYELSVSIVKLTKPMFGAAFTVDMEAGWSLIKTSDKSVAMRQVIKSTYTGGAFDSLVGTTRLRMSVEGAARNNIKQGLEAVAALNL